MIEQQIRAQTAVLYEQQVNQIRKEFADKFDAEVHKMQMLANKENKQIPIFSESANPRPLDRVGSIENPENVRQHAIFPKSHRTAFTEFPTTIRTRSDSDSEYERSVNISMHH